MIANDPYGEMQMWLARLPDTASTIVSKGDFPRAQKIFNKAPRRGVASPRLDQLESKIGAIVQTISRSKNT